MLQDVLAQGSVEDIEHISYAAGSVLASLGMFTFPDAGFFGPGPGLVVDEPFPNAVEAWRGYVEMCLSGGAGDQLGPDLTERVRRLLSEGAPYIEQTDGESKLVHADYNGSNVLVTQEGSTWRVAAVLDWEWALSYTPMTDMGIMLRDRVKHPPVFSDSFVRGFAENGGKLYADWQMITRLIDLINLCEFLNSESHRPALMEYVKGVIIATLEDWKI